MAGQWSLLTCFCCQWMPEVYVEDTRTMEPIVNLEGMKETRKKLICYLCKVKWGACVRCCDGMFCCLFYTTLHFCWMVHQDSILVIEVNCYLTLCCF
ncbi:unnamed protein product [Ilex paraguariensis]|uniref:Uncharacterized protein n=1 Tax=Ilex paraguariensis TaxID=185542 RepID=A0ABC8U2X5_9AQUA